MENKIKLLYIDDQEMNLNIFKILLRDDKYEVFTADNVDEGMELLQTSSDIDIIFSDMHMPRCSGLDFISDARKIYPDKIYVLLTANIIGSDVHEAINNSIIDKCIMKPLSKDLLFSTIDELMSK